MNQIPKAIDPATPVENVPEFYIPATEAIGTVWPRILKHNDTFAMFDHHGDIVGAADNPAGLFHRDTRYLSGFYILVEGNRPLLLESSMVQEDNTALTADLANPDIYRGDELLLSRETLHLIRTKFLWQDACYERISVQNFDQKAHTSRMLVRFDADFADLFEARGIKRDKRGVRTVTKEDAQTVTFRYVGLDNITRVTRVRFDPAPMRLDNHQAVYDVTLAPQERQSAFITITYGDDQPAAALPSFGSAMRASRRAARAKSGAAAAVSSSNQTLNQMLCRSIADLTMLVTQTSQGPYPYAGIPWFSTAFGRDGIITALQTLWLDPGIAKGVLKFLAATQAQKADAKSDAEPGKILHETRHGEMANTGEVPFGLYYGSVDATPLFVLLAGRYFERTGDLETVRAIWPNIQAALGWIGTYGDADGDGFVEYQRKSANGLGNQGWKDSNDSIMHADGTLAKGPIALVEVQGYVYAAKRAAAAIATCAGRRRRRTTSKKKPRRCACCSRRNSGASASAPTVWRSTARKGFAK